MMRLETDSANVKVIAKKSFWKPNGLPRLEYERCIYRSYSILFSNQSHLDEIGQQSNISNTMFMSNFT